jgi:hypothetical protein
MYDRTLIILEIMVLTFVLVCFMHVQEGHLKTIIDGFKGILKSINIVAPDQTPFALKRIDDVLSTQHLLLAVGDAKDLQKKLDELTRFVEEQFKLDGLSESMGELGIGAPSADGSVARAREQFEDTRKASKDVLKWCNLRHYETQRLLKRQQETLNAIVVQGEQTRDSIAKMSEKMEDRHTVLVTCLVAINAERDFEVARLEQETAKVKEEAARRTLAAVASGSAAVAASSASASASAGASPLSRRRTDSVDSGRLSVSSEGPQALSDGNDSDDSGIGAVQHTVITGNAAMLRNRANREWNDYVLANKQDIDDLLEELWEHTDAVGSAPQLTTIVVNRTEVARLRFKLEVRSDALLPSLRERVGACLAQLKEMLRADGALDEDELKRLIYITSHDGSVVVLLRATRVVLATIFRCLNEAGESWQLGAGVTLLSIRPVLSVTFEANREQQRSFFDQVIAALEAGGGLDDVLDAARKGAAVQRFISEPTGGGKQLQFFVSCKAIEAACAHRKQLEGATAGMQGAQEAADNVRARACLCV